MFSLENFYHIIYRNLLEHNDFLIQYPYKFGSTSPDGYCNFNKKFIPGAIDYKDHIVLFYDQEPIYTSIVDNFYNEMFLIERDPNFHGSILANSEYSDEKIQVCKKYNYIDWYYFYHGFAALDWYRDFKYFPKNKKPFSKVFMTLNHLISGNRSYRLDLVSQLIEQNLLQFGNISCQLADHQGTWKNEIFSRESQLLIDSKKRILSTFSQLEKPLVADTEHLHGQLSANIDLDYYGRSFFNLVTETVFYHNKLHLTEKVFKPIVARQPFILAAAVGNLEYLRSYGFKTFGTWIDESYDQEPNNEIRLTKIVNEIKKLCSLPFNELCEMQQDMEDTLEYNFNHFYGEFRAIIVSELINNFYNCTCQINNSRLTKRILTTKQDLKTTYNLLTN